MKYYMRKSANKTTASAGKYVAKVFHANTVDVDTFAEKIAYSCSLSQPDVRAALSAFGREIAESLRQGDIVKLPGLGTFKLEMECTPVASPNDFNPAKHLRRYQIHVLPESKDHHRPLYDGIELSKVK